MNLLQQQLSEMSSKYNEEVNKTKQPVAFSQLYKRKFIVKPKPSNELDLE